jgi:ferrochelatase
MNYDAILLTSFGGPENPDEVMPFLERVTAGRGIPRERLEEVSHHYLALGGVSPINEQNRELQAHLREELAKRKIHIPLYLGNRNSQPFFADVLREMFSDGHRRVLSVVTSAYSSYSGCRQYRENLFQALIDADLAGQMSIDKVRHYFDHPGFVLPFANGLVEALRTLANEGFAPASTHIFFTTHSVPMSMAQTSGPESIRETFQEGIYVAQHNAAAKAIMEIAGKESTSPLPAWSLVYQSRSGAPHMPWLEPDIGDSLRGLASSITKAVVVVPIGFVSDHVEVIWDLDNEAKAIADEENLRFIRISTPGKDKEFVAGLVDLIEERLANSPRKALSPLGPWADFCSADCCPNLRQELPTIAAQRN